MSDPMVLSVVPAHGDPVEVEVQVRDAPGPSGFGLLFDLLPEIDASALEDKATLLAFFAGVLARPERPVVVSCLRPRLQRMIALLGCEPGITPAVVNLPDG